MKLLLASTKAPLQLGAVVGRGGEGTVHEIASAPQRVTKIYSRDPTPEKVAKLTAMTAAGDAQLLGIAAWPIDLVVDSRGTTKGFVMPRIASRADIHELYSPKSRAQEFPEADFRFLVHVATNISRAVAIVHKHGHVIGDINHGSLLIGRDGTVVLIDCDSMQITGNGAHDRKHQQIEGASKATARANKSAERIACQRRRAGRRSADVAAHPRR